LVKLSFFSTHSGAGGACLGAIAAGLESVGGIEIDNYCVELHRANFGNGIRHESILDTPIEQLPDFDFLWTSPPCQSHSVAKIGGEETADDIAQSQKIAHIIAFKRPQYFALENVRGFFGSAGYGIILKTLIDLNYFAHAAIYDSASFGVPQNRNRLILRASRDPLRDLLPTHAKYGGLWWQPWNGWYDAIADLLPSCKPSRLTERQILALKNKGWYGEVQQALAVSNKYLQQNGKPGRCDALPIGTVTTQSRLIAVLLERVGYGKERDPTIRTANDPSITIKASAGCDERGGFRSPLTALLERADIRALDYRCLARLQSFSDSYQWWSSAGKNCRAIGNAVPPLFAQRIVESMV
jgi:DNA (cytosine-5)-methyltransferase 1